MKKNLPASYIRGGIYLRPSLIERSTLTALSEALLDQRGLHLLVARREDVQKKKRVRVERPEQLADAVSAVSPSRFGLSDFIIWLEPTGACFFVSGSRKTLPLELNRIGLEIQPAHWKREATPDSWIEGFIARLAILSSVRYAFACRSGEFDTQNLEEGPSGVRALGRSFQTCLPGLYWFNFFGSECAAALNFPAPTAQVVVRNHADGFLVRLSEASQDWTDPSYRQARIATLGMLGSSYFFDRNDSARQTKAVVFAP